MIMMERIKWVDNLKGFILLLVCIGHVHFKTGLLFQVSVMCAAFRMTTFMFLSGYLYSIRKHKTFASYCKSKSKSLLLPYICLSILFSFFDLRLYDVSLIPYHPYIEFPILAFLGVPETIQNSIEYLYLEVVNIFAAGTSTPITTPLWFVNALFWTSLFFYLIHKLSSNFKEGKYLKLTILFYACIMLSIGWICNKQNLFLPFNFHVVCSSSFYFSIGYLAKDVINKKMNTLPIHYLLLMLVIIGPIYLYGINVNGAISLYINSLGGELYGLIIASLSGIAGIVTTFILLSRIPKTSIIGGIFRNLARNALIFLAMHYWVIITCDVVFHEYANSPIYKYVVLGAAIIISVLSFPIFRNKLYKLLGKEKISMKESLSLK